MFVQKLAGLSPDDLAVRKSEVFGELADFLSQTRGADASMEVIKSLSDMSRLSAAHTKTANEIYSRLTSAGLLVGYNAGRNTDRFKQGVPGFGPR